jgi:1-acyl-sn-glycerol-3-phosphate acyltransferase
MPAPPVTPPITTTLTTERTAPAAAVEAAARTSWADKVCFLARTTAGYLVYGFVAVVAVIFCVATAALVRSRARQKVICQRIIHLCLRSWARFSEWCLIYRVDFPDSARLREMRGTIIAPNHISLIDATHFLARLPRLTCLMKSTLRHNPFTGGSSALAGYLPNDNNREFIRRGRDALRAGENLLIFPEGTRTIKPPVNRFKRGFALIATLAEAPVQTVFIEMPVLYLGKRWPIWRAVAMPIPITIRLGRLFPAQPGRTAKALAEELEEYFRASLEGTLDGGVRQVRRGGETCAE